MRHTLPCIIGAAMIILAGCSSKSAVSTGDASGAGSGAGSGTGAGVVVEDGSGAGKGAGSGSGAGNTFAGPVLGDVFYDFDSSALSPEAQDQLKQNAVWFQRNSVPAVIVEGHCDERGTDEYNIALGERRAVAAKEYLVNLGVGNGRITAVSFGEERPFDPGHNEEAWAKNRRAHFLTK
ncbi:MAG: peptidoglycan-associated lipoprotein Pal [Chlorobiaceae bacterium]|nr:peptidoglycan-associated lipoprotein Pal [Chlorobiaceae bacterium]